MVRWIEIMDGCMFRKKLRVGYIYIYIYMHACTHIHTQTYIPTAYIRVVNQ